MLSLPMMDQRTPFPPNLLAGLTRVTARALLVGDRLDTSGLERGDALSVMPLALPAGIAVLFRYGVVALIGLTTLEEDEVLRTLRPRVVRELSRREEETAVIELSA